MLERASALNRVLGRWGVRIVRTRPQARQAGPYSTLFPNRDIVDLESLIALGETIPGMLSEESAKFLFALCYMQQMPGDVVEIGSWQGYSTSFLARAVAESRNGRMYAIDHFKGNVGKEKRYRVGEDDLSDLQHGFQANMERLGLAENIRVLAMPNAAAAKVLEAEAARVRFLFIDGDHSIAGAERDVELFFPFLGTGSIVVFDDCSPAAPGVIAVVDRLVEQRIPARVFGYANTAVMML